MSLLEEAEIWASGSRPDSRPCRSEHGASGVESSEGRDNFNLHLGRRGRGVVDGEVSAMT